ncbi:MAG: GDP-mannose 4,6-dehydratase [Roseovarius sp.]
MPYLVTKLYACRTTVNDREPDAMYACNGLLFHHKSLRRDEPCVSREAARGLAPRHSRLAGAGTRLGPSTGAEAGNGSKANIPDPEPCADKVIRDLKTTRRARPLREHGQDLPISVKR